MHVLIRLFTIFCFSLLISCGGGGSKTTNHSPQVNIVTPEQDALFIETGLIIFKADVSDPDGETIADNSIIWRSSLAGEIGLGAILNVDDLSAGVHDISVTATDSKQASASDSINITVSPKIIGDNNNSITGSIVNAKTGIALAQAVTLEFVSNGNLTLVDSVGDTLNNSLVINNGRVNFAVKQAAYPALLKIIAHADGYLSSSKIIRLKQSGNIDFQFFLNEKANLAAGISSKTLQSALADSSGKLDSRVELSTDKAVDYAGIVSFNIDQDTQITDSNGTPLSGNLTVEATYFNSTSNAALRSFPGGLTIDSTTLNSINESSIMPPAGINEGWFISGGFTAITVTDENGGRGVNFDKDIEIVMQVAKATYNPLTKQALQLGDDFPIWSYNEDTGEWLFHSMGVVQAVSGSDDVYQVTIVSNHLSSYNADFPMYNTQPGGSGDDGDADPADPGEGGGDSDTPPDDDSGDGGPSSRICDIDINILGSNTSAMNMNIDTSISGGGYTQTINVGLDRSFTLANLPGGIAFDFVAWYQDENGQRQQSNLETVENVCDSDAINLILNRDLPITPSTIAVNVSETLGSCDSPEILPVDTWVIMSTEDNSVAEQNKNTNAQGDTQFVLAIEQTKTVLLEAYNPRTFSYESQTVEINSGDETQVDFSFSYCTATTVNLSSITIEPDSALVLSGNDQQFVAIGSYQDGSTQDITTAVTWNSSNTNIAGISNRIGTQGLGRAYNIGETNIVATLREKSASALLTVTDTLGNEHIVSIKINPADLSVIATHSRQLSAIATYDNSNQKDVTDEVDWSVANESIAQINNESVDKGTVTGVAAGQTVVSATLGDSLGQRAIDVIAQLPEEDRWLDISAGNVHSLAVRADGTLWAWGANISGQLGDGTKQQRTEPTQIGNDIDWALVAAGYTHSAAIKTDGSLWTWGSNFYGELGNGVNDHSTVVTEPTRIGDSNDWPTIKKRHRDNFSSGFGATYIIKDDGSLWGWGKLDVENTVSNIVLVPTKIGDDNDWALVYYNYYRAFAIKNDNSLWQLGDPSILGQTEPFQITDSSDWSTIFNINDFFVAVKSDASLWIWGDSITEYYGDDAHRLEPTATPFGMTWSTRQSSYNMEMGLGFIVGLKDDGSLWTWGRYAIGENAPYMIPAQIGDEYDWQTVSTHYAHVLALKIDGTLWAWGENYLGELGDGTTEYRYQPKKIIVDPDVPAVDLESIVLSPDSPTLVVNSSVNFTAVGSYSDSTTSNITATVDWSSSNPDIATINTNTFILPGKATALDVGQTTISATLDSISGETVLNVIDTEIVSIAVSPVDLNLISGTQASLSALATYSNGTTRNVTTEADWSSTDDLPDPLDVVIVGNVGAGKGTIFAVAPGVATVTATIGEISGSVTVTVSPQ